MHINKTNYENYFLLYIDKELSASDQAAVESFVQENPQYANELNSLQKTTILPEAGDDKIIYPNKALLYRLPEMEATLSAQFKNKLYKSSTTILRPSFNFKPKAALLSVAALFIVFIGYRFAQVNNNTLPTTGSTLSKATLLKQISAKKNAIETLAKADHFKKTKTNHQLTIEKNNFKQVNEAVAILKNTPSMAANETASLMNKEATPMLKELQQNNSSPIIENILEKNDLPATETFVEEQSNKEAKGYKVIDTDDTDRTIYIANFEIDGAAVRGLTRRFNAMFKRNKSEK
jgi:hypothetical protein